MSVQNTSRKHGFDYGTEQTKYLQMQQAKKAQDSKDLQSGLGYAKMAYGVADGICKAANDGTGIAETAIQGIKTASETAKATKEAAQAAEEAAKAGTEAGQVAGDVAAEGAEVGAQVGSEAANAGVEVGAEVAQAAVPAAAEGAKVAADTATAVVGAL
ncbi:hypothetical protein K1X76_10200 [bacterium]|nr:hypothetical protein [bacterium]